MSEVDHFLLRLLSQLHAQLAHLLSQMVQELLLYLIVDIFYQSFHNGVSYFLTVKDAIQLDAYFQIPVK